MAIPAPDGAPGWAAPPQPPAPPPPAPPPPVPPVRPQPRWIAPLSLIVALIAIAVAVWALIRPEPTPPTPAGPTAQEIQTSTARTCGAYLTVSKAVSLQTHADLGPEPIAQAAVAANARLAMAAGADYLLAHIDPATPAGLSDAAKRFADDLHSIAMGALAGQVNSDAGQTAKLVDAEKTGNKIEGFCSR